MFILLFSFFVTTLRKRLVVRRYILMYPFFYTWQRCSEDVGWEKPPVIPFLLYSKYFLLFYFIHVWLFSPLLRVGRFFPRLLTHSLYWRAILAPSSTPAPKRDSPRKLPWKCIIVLPCFGILQPGSLTLAIVEQLIFARFTAVAFTLWWLLFVVVLD